MMKIIRHLLLSLICLAGASVTAEAGTIGGRAVTGKTQEDRMVVSEDRLRNIFSAYLCRHLDKDKSDIIVSRFTVRHNTPVSKGDVDIQLFRKSKGSLKGLVRLAAMIHVNGVVENEVRLSGWVDVFSPVVCAARNLKKGALVGNDAIVMERKNISRLPADLVQDKSRALGLLAKHSIRQGTALKEWMLERSPVLLKGDPVTILVEKGLIRITVPGKSLEKGYPGELIRVRNAMSRKEIYARVRNNRTVTVDF